MKGDYSRDSQSALGEWPGGGEDGGKVEEYDIVAEGSQASQNERSIEVLSGELNRDYCQEMKR